MSLIKLYGHPMSTCTRRVLTVLLEKKVQFEMVTLDMKSRKLPEHLARQPFGRIPVLQDGNFWIYESRAICRYLAGKYEAQGTKLLPERGETEGWGLFEQACSIEYSYFNPAAEGLANEQVFKVMKGGKTNEEHAKSLEADLESTLKVYNTILGKQKYLAGDTLTLADLFHLPYGKTVREIGYEGVFEGEGKENVKRWFEEISARGSWVEANGGKL